MPRFFLFEEQGGGCDYSIGCGFRLREIDASTMKEAIEIVTKDDKDPFIRVYGDSAIESARILQVDVIEEIDLVTIASERNKKRQEKIATRKNKEDRKEYERLKKKFE
jgi:hypothetical protein